MSPTSLAHGVTAHSLPHAHWMARAAPTASTPSAGHAPATVNRPQYATKIRRRMCRFVSNDDIVPQVPPEPLYRHVDALRHIDSRGLPYDSRPPLGGPAERARGLTADAFAPAVDGLRDHPMKRCLAALEQNLP